jgi:peptidoglycan/LPS O-acetylase OafA/YrhL
VNKRFPAVDLIRGLCIVNVVIHHTNIRIPFARSAMGSVLPDFVIRFLFWTGDYSVKIFFVISGFLITTSILSRWGSLERIDVAQFYRRRFARIAPCLLALLAILSVLHLAHAQGFTIAAGRASLPRALLAALTLHLGWLEAKTGYLPGAWDILWSLSVEETFYLAYPVLCRFAHRRVLIGVGGVLMILGPLGRTRFAFNDIWADYSYLSGMDAIAMGCAAVFLARNFTIRTRWSLRIVGLTLALCVLFRGVARSMGLLKTGLDVTVLALGIVLILITIGEDSGQGQWKPLAWFGRNSYEIYLTHMFVVTIGTTLYNSIGKPVSYAPVWFVMNLALAGLLGAAVARWYSIPWNRRLTRQQRAPVEQCAILPA